jgi:hypothetical protein
LWWLKCSSVDFAQNQRYRPSGSKRIQHYTNYFIKNVPRIFCISLWAYKMKVFPETRSTGAF